MSFKVNSSNIISGIAGKKRNDISEINIFFGDCRSYFVQSKPLEKYLTATEKQFMNKLYFEEDRTCYLVVHGLFKKHLAENLSCQTISLEINYIKDRKPFITDIDFDFNLSHSSPYFAFIISDNNSLKVGVDIEKIRPHKDLQSIATNYFSIEECAYMFQSMDNEMEHIARFYELWTRKEAFLKMAGIGLVNGINNIPVTTGINMFDFELPKNLLLNSSSICIFTKREKDYVISVACTEERVPVFIELKNDEDKC